jgi:hypothetical protein
MTEYVVRSVTGRTEPVFRSVTGRSESVVRSDTGRTKSEVVSTRLHSLAPMTKVIVKWKFAEGGIGI